MVVNKSVFCKDFLGIFPDALQFWAVDVRLLFLGQDAQLVTVMEIQAMYLGFPEEYLEENLEDAFSCIGILGAIPFRCILSGRMFQLIQP